MGTVTDTIEELLLLYDEEQLKPAILEMARDLGIFAVEPSGDELLDELYEAEDDYEAFTEPDQLISYALNELELVDPVRLGYVGELLEAIRPLESLMGLSDVIKLKQIINDYKEKEL